nr:MAG TPA: hypothetical protein [Caudoviricetes sp.]
MRGEMLPHHRPPHQLGITIIFFFYANCFSIFKVS